MSKFTRGGTLVVMRLFQATPLLMQLFIFYFGLSIMELELSARTSVSIALIFYTGACLGEIWQGCIQAVPKGQSDAGKALALTYIQWMSRLILPQATRIALAPTVGFLVQVIKSTSLASIVGFAELICVTHKMGFARKVADSIIFMDAVGISFSGSPDQFFQTDENARVRDFIGKINHS